MDNFNEYLNPRRSDDKRDREEDSHHRHKHRRGKYRDDSASDNYDSEDSRSYEYDEEYPSSRSSSPHSHSKERRRSRDRYDRRRERERNHRSHYTSSSGRSGRSRSRSPPSRRRDSRFEKATSTLIIQGLPQSITEKDLRTSLEEARFNFSSYRIMRDRKTGIPKGFAFVDFYSVDDARVCLDDSRGFLTVLDCKCHLNYATPREDGDDDGAANSWRSEEPQNTIMLRGLPLHTSEIEIRNLLDLQIAKYVDVRVIVNRRTGESKGFGFVEFDSIASAQEWMERQQGVLHVGSQEVRLLYSTPKPSDTHMERGNSSGNHTDWMCNKCSTHNFKRRDRCFRCNASRQLGDHPFSIEVDDGSDLVGATPCNTLLLRYLDALTTEDNIINAFTQLTSVPVVQCYVLRDDMTRLSRCCAIVEFSSVTEAEHILEVNLKDKTTMFDIDGKAVTVTYAKHTFSTIMAMEKHKKALREQLGDDCTFNNSLYSSVGDLPSTSTLDSTTSLLQKSGADVSNSANAAAALAQAALQKKHSNYQAAAVIAQQMKLAAAAAAHGDSGSLVAASITSSSAGEVSVKMFEFSSWETSKFPVPDTSKFTFDATSGFYYDVGTTLYYDATSKYFYDSRTQEYLYWEGITRRYIPASQLQKIAPQPAGEKTTDSPPTTSMTTNQEEKKEKKSQEKKTKSAKQIAKEMERWAKQMNTTKCVDVRPPTVQTVTSTNTTTSTTGGRAADTGFAMLEALQTPGLRSLVASQYDSGEDAADNKTAANKVPISNADPETTLAAEEEKMIDNSRLACLLCSRAFKDMDTLQKHRNHSDLHKKNLETLRERLGLPSTSQASPASGSNTVEAVISIAQEMLAEKGRGSSSSHYRDRAKERRQKYGIVNSPKAHGKVRAVTSSREEEEQDVTEEGVDPVVVPSVVPATTAPLTSDNVGARLMQKMGWQVGQGLGRDNQGRTSIVEAEMRQSGAGLGSSSAKVARASSSGQDNYKDKVKQAMFARFQELE